MLKRQISIDVLTTIPEDEKLDMVNKVLSKVKLEDTNTKMPSEISGGMQKRVGIARALVNNSKYLFCDEPNSGLDPKTSIKIDQLCKKLRKSFKPLRSLLLDMNSTWRLVSISFLYLTEKSSGRAPTMKSSIAGLRHLTNLFANKMMRKFKGI